VSATALPRFAEERTALIRNQDIQRSDKVALQMLAIGLGMLFLIVLFFGRF